VAVVKQLVLHIVSVFEALGIQYATRMRYIVICGLSGSKAYYLIYGMILKNCWT
jgi:hypothetical protein